MNRFAVKRVEGDAGLRESKSADESIDGRVTGVGNGDVFADAGGAELLAPHDGADDVVKFGIAEIARAVKAVDHFADDALLGRGGQRRHDGILDYKIRHLHPEGSSSRRIMPGGRPVGAGRDRDRYLLLMSLCDGSRR